MCDCLNNTDPTWEIESQAIFRALAEGRFPLNKRVKDALDMIVKLAKTGNAPPPAITIVTSSNTITNDELEGRQIAALLIGDTPKSTGFAKVGDTAEEKLASDTVEITEGIMPPDTLVVIIFK